MKPEDRFELTDENLYVSDNVQCCSRKEYVVVGANLDTKNGKAEQLKKQILEDYEFQTQLHDYLETKVVGCKSPTLVIKYIEELKDKADLYDKIFPNGNHEEVDKMVADYKDKAEKWDKLKFRESSELTGILMNLNEQLEQQIKELREKLEKQTDNVYDVLDTGLKIREENQKNKLIVEKIREFVESEKFRDMMADINPEWDFTNPVEAIIKKFREILGREG